MDRFSLTNNCAADLAIDLGTANTRVVTAKGGIVFNEPSLCCFAGTGSQAQLIAAGAGAQEMIDRTSGSWRIAHPLIRGVLEDIDAAKAYLRYAILKGVGKRRIGSYKAIIGIPADATSAERSALLTAANDAGLGAVTLVDEPVLAALGAGISIERAEGTMILECGAGITEATLLSLDRICMNRSIRLGGDALNAAIADYLHFHHKFLIGKATAERVKRELVDGRLDAGARSPFIEIKGRNQLTCLPGTIHVATKELDAVIHKHVHHIVELVLSVLNEMPPELSQDVLDKGIMLTGGSAVIGLIGEAIKDATGVTCIVADQNALCVALGLQRVLGSS